MPSLRVDVGEEEISAIEFLFSQRLQGNLTKHLSSFTTACLTTCVQY